jgi:RNA polymerase sigma-70 factor (ECF subfamily)
MAADEFITSVRAAHASGLAAWPGVALPVSAFADHVEERLGRAGAMRRLAQHGEDLFLACACARGDPRAIELFSTQLLATLPPIVSRIVRSDALVEELVQSLHEMILVRRGEETPPRIAEYRGTGSLLGWVRVTATRAAVRMKKRAGRFASEEDVGERVAATTLGPEKAYMKRRYGPAFDAALREALAELDEAPREVLRRYYVEGLTIDELAAREGIHRATAARRVESARKRILTALRRGAAERLGIGGEEVDSLMGLVASRLEISLRELKSE